MNAKAAWLWAVLAGLFLAVVVALIVLTWFSIGPSEITPAGWVAMILGVLLTLGLGIGLMSLVFISSRRGFDDDGNR